MTRALVIVLAAFSLLLTAPMQRASAETQLNGMRVNGMRVNGMRVNGMRVNGMRVNGMRVNGMRVNGMRVNGMRVNGMRVNGTHVANNRGIGALTIAHVTADAGQLIVR